MAAKCPCPKCGSLKTMVEQLGLEFFDVDPGRKGRRQNEECRSWGCNGETANSWECWRQRIDRVEPFFACILGQRHGWVPERKVDT